MVKMVNNEGSLYEHKYEELYLEIERLTRELDQAVSDKIQSAKCGLALLEEKCIFQQKCAELEELYENAKHELNITKNALVKLEASQKITTENGIEQEDALLNESAAMESTLTLHIFELENEIKQVRKELERVVHERDNLLQENSIILKEKAAVEADKLKLKTELKELKQIRKKLVTNCLELEDENCILQKKLLDVKCFEEELQTKYRELQRLADENLYLTQQLTDMTNLKLIAESKLEDALKAYEIEHEVKITLKRELDIYYKGSIYKTKSLAESITEVKEYEYEVCSNRSTIYSETDLEDLNDPDGGFLLQIFNELKMLETKLEQFEGEKKDQEQGYNENANKNHEVHCIKSKVALVAANINALIQLERYAAAETATKGMEGSSNGIEVDKVEIQRCLSNSVTDFMSTLKSEFADIRSQLKSLGLDVDESSRFTESLENIKEARNYLIYLNKDFIQFFKELSSKNENLAGYLGSYEGEHEHALPDIRSNLENSRDCQLMMFSCDLKKYAELLSEHFKHLKTATELKILSEGKTISNQICDNMKQIKNLESLLSKKRKQIALLETTIKSNTEVAMKAFSDIRNKYEKEKASVEKTISSLVSEIEILTEEIAGIKRLRTIFTERCSQYMGNLDKLTENLELEQAENKLLSNILKTAVKQKFDLQNRLEELKKKRKKKVRFNLPKNSCIKI